MGDSRKAESLLVVIQVVVLPAQLVIHKSLVLQSSMPQSVAHKLVVVQLVVPFGSVRIGSLGDGVSSNFSDSKSWISSIILSGSLTSLSKVF